MTENEWLAGTDSVAMLIDLRGKSTERKLRLFACGCCRRMWGEKPADLAHRAIT